MTYKRPNPRTHYCGVYAIHHIPSGRLYIGGSTDMTGRWTHHRYMLRRGRHKSSALQDLWINDGEESFEFIVLERCEQDKLADVEQYYLNESPNHLNSSPFVSGYVPATEVIKKHMSEGSVRRWAKPEYQEKREGFLNTRDKGRFVKNQDAILIG